MQLEKTILNFGKYNGKTDKEYCNWFFRNLDYNLATDERKQFYDFLRKNN